MQFHPVPALPPLCLPPEILGDISRGIVVRRDYLNIAGAEIRLSWRKRGLVDQDLIFIMMTGKKEQLLISVELFCAVADVQRKQNKA